jgi:CBS domain-containing membrane protein
MAFRVQSHDGCHHHKSAHVFFTDLEAFALRRCTKGPLRMPVYVKDIMAHPVVTLFAEQTLPLAEDIMAFKHLRHLPVVDDERQLLGLVSHRDLLRAQISSLSGLSDSQKRARIQDVKVREVMTRDVWTVLPDTLAIVACRTLLDHRFGCLPVVDTRHHLVGIVTERDFLKLVLGMVE